MAKAKKSGGGAGGGGGGSKQHAAPVSDPRFARVQTDPRFLQPKRQDLKVTLDDRFSHLLDKGGKAGGKGKGKPKTDRFGRPLKKGASADAQLKSIYKVEGEDDDSDEDDESSEDDAAGGAIDYARGEGLLESSSDEDSSEEEDSSEDSESDTASSDSDEEEEVVIGGKKALRQARKAAETAEGSSDGEDSDVSDPELDAEEEAKLLAGAEDELDAAAIAALDAEAEQATRRAAKASSSGRKGKSKSRSDDDIPRGDDTSRLAVVNLDWDHIRARDLYRVFSSVVSPLASGAAEGAAGARARRRSAAGGEAIKRVRGKCLRVRIYPSDYGRERMRREDIEGPPREIFASAGSASAGGSAEASGSGISKSKKKKGKKRRDESDEDDDDDLFKEDEGGEFDEEQLRKYQLDRLRYYYAIAEFDSPESARHVYNEIDGTEMEASANIFDLRFVPDGMTFPEHELNDPNHPDADARDAGWRDEATALTEGVDGAGGGSYKGIDFKTDALRHSKVKLTWDADDPERAKMTRKSRNALLAGGDVRDEDFKAYLASDNSDQEEEDEEEAPAADDGGKRGRDRLRALLLDGAGSSGFGGKGGRGKATSSAFDDPRRLGNAGADGEGDMEITFTPGLSEAAARKAAKETKAAEGEETTLEKYLRKQKEKRQAKKEARLKKIAGEGAEDKAPAADAAEDGEQLGFDDPFFGSDNEIDFDEALAAEQAGRSAPKSKSKSKPSKAAPAAEDPEAATAEDLGALLDTEAAPAGGVGHFDMKDILRAEKEGAKGKKKNRFEKRRAKKEAANADKDVREVALQEGFKVDAGDDRFTAMYEDHRFALDPSHKSFLKTKGMEEILKAKRERSKGKGPREREAPAEAAKAPASSTESSGNAGDDLLALARKLKKRSGEQVNGDGNGKKRRKG